MSQRNHLPAWGADQTRAAAVALTLATVWLVVKFTAIWGWVIAPGEYGDTYYYFLTAQEVRGAGGTVADAFGEYPTPAGLLLLLPWDLGATTYEGYRSAVMVMTTLADAAFTLLLGRRLGPVAVVGWTALTLSMGQLALLRFDLLPAVVAGAAVLFAMEQRRVLASVLVALGTGLKVWPIVLFPLTWGRSRAGIVRPAVALAAAGGGLVGVSLFAGGWERLLSPLAYQRERGLQIEAVAATVPMNAWADDPAYHVWYSTFHAFEVVGPSVGWWLTAAHIATGVGVGVCLVLLARWLLAGAPPESITWLALVFVGTFVVTSRALSPQYLLWLAAPAAVLLGRAFLGEAGAAGLGRGGGGVVRSPVLVPALVTFALVALLCGLTTAVYPVHYDGLIGRGALTDRALVLLTVRNIGLVVLVAWASVCAWVSTRRPAP